jgi:cellulose synthase/poly-beta-1,6-N-acetylglucosamine synthase-like glycosyltransferase
VPSKIQLLQLLGFASLFILVTQLTFLILFLVAFRRKPVIKTDTLTPVSVIVCAHDEEENLRELIPLLLAQDYPEFEVIIVEDRCNDGTYDFLLQATKENSRLKMVRVTQKPEHINGKKFALTLGIKAARYSWVLLTDADCRPSSNLWIASVASRFTEPTKIVLGFSPYLKSPGLLNAFIRFESFLTGIQFMGMALLGRPYMGVGRNLAYRKELFLENKGFNDHLGVTGGDDDLFVNQHATHSNTRVALETNALVFSKPKNTWGEFLHQKFRHLSVGRFYKLSDKFLLGLFSGTWLLTWFLALPALFFLPWMNFLLAVFIVRWAMLIALMHTAPQRMGTSFEAWKAPFLDFMFAFYYLVTGAKALIVKKVKWKN